MAFWGVEVSPGKPYCHNFDRSRGRLRISQATLGDGKSGSKSTVRCSVGNSSLVLLCTLLPNVLETCHLELEFEEDKEVIFTVLGSRSIHLTGYYPGHVHCLDGDDTESYGEDIAESDTSDNYTGGSEDQYESDFIDDDDDDVEVYTDFPVHKSNVVIEEIEDDDKSCDRTRKLRRLKKKHESSDAENAETGSKQLVVRKNGPSKVESEDEDGFPTCFTAKSRSSKKKIDDDKTSKTAGICHDTVSDKKSKTDDIDTVFVSEANVNHDSTMPAESAHVYNEKPKKKKKKDNKPSIGSENDDKHNNQNESAKVEEKSENVNISIIEIQEHANDSLNGAKDTCNDGVNTPVTFVNPAICKMSKKKNKKKRAREEGVSDEKVPCGDKIDTDKLTQVDMMPIDKKNKPKKSKKKNSDSDINHEASAKEKKDVIDDVDGSQHGSHSIKTRSFPNGLIVEEVYMGQPEGKKASPGKKVSVRYIGKLKNGTIFDSNIGQKPFKFRLGIGEVIKGWDIGVSGMRVGDKRRLTIPPSFGYGAKGVGKIPPNSWLVFDVELADVQ